MDAVKNFVKVTLDQGYDDVATSVDLITDDGAKLPDPAVLAFKLTWWNVTDYSDPSDDPNVEIVRCTARSTDTLTITRAQESTAAATHNEGGKTYKMILAPTAGEKIGFLDATGSVDDANVEFTFAIEPLIVVVNGVSYRHTHGCTIAGTTVTLDYAVGTGGDIFGIKGA